MSPLLGLLMSSSSIASFSTQPKKVLLVGAGFLGKYFLTRMFEGYEDYLLKGDKNYRSERARFHGQLPLVYILDKQNSDSLYKFPLLENYQGKNYSEYLWQSMGDIMSLQYNDIHNKVDDVVITSAIADVPYAMKSPFDTYQTNVINTLQLMEYLRANNFAGRIILLSSESVLGHQPEDKLPLKEDDIIPNPANVYGSSKLAQEQIVLTYAKSYGMNATVLRSATMYGPYGRTKQAIPIFIKQILDGKPVTLEGDGSQSRDFVYVEDTARAIELALYTKENTKGEIINIGSGKETKFISLIVLIAQTIGLDWNLGTSKDYSINYKPFREGEEGLRVSLDISKAQKLLGYQPQYPMTGMDESGLKTTIQWVANWVLNWDEKEMDNLRRNMYPSRYPQKYDSRTNKGKGGNIEVSI